MKYQSKPRHKKTAVIVIACVLAFAVGAFLIYFFLLGGNKILETSTKNSSDTRSINDVDYSGPTDEDISNSQNGKKNGENNNNQSGTDKVIVGITFAEVTGPNLDIRAFTPSVIEGNGTCTAVLTKNGETSVTRSSSAFIDASSSQCRPIYIDIGEFPSKGTWTLRIEYSSPTHKGVSDTIEVEV